MHHHIVAQHCKQVHDAGIDSRDDSQWISLTWGTAPLKLVPRNSCPPK